jgi:hypothetical protein
MTSVLSAYLFSEEHKQRAFGRLSLWDACDTAPQVASIRLASLTVVGDANDCFGIDLHSNREQIGEHLAGVPVITFVVPFKEARLLTQHIAELYSNEPGLEDALPRAFGTTEYSGEDVRHLFIFLSGLSKLFRSPDDCIVVVGTDDWEDIPQGQSSPT